MRDLAGRYAAELMGHKDRQRDLDADMVENDVKTANGIGDQPFYLTYSCDRRGRIYANQYFNFGRQDYVRAMFRFHNGMRLGKKEDIETLELHCAKCGGFDGVDKKKWTERIKWSRQNRKLITDIAERPFDSDTLARWKDADKPFSFVAACRELAAAWADPQSFVTHLPIVFDGSCNGLQHLSLISRDAKAGKRTNLIHPDGPQYRHGDVGPRGGNARLTTTNGRLVVQATPQT
jgi:DNA-directed RNA polymerase